MPSNAPLIYLGHRWTGAARADRAYISAAKRPPHGVVSNIVDLVVCICCLGAVCLVSFHLHVPIRKDETYPVWPLACGFIMTLSLYVRPVAVLYWFRYAHPELLLGNDVPALSAVRAGTGGDLTFLRDMAVRVPGMSRNALNLLVHCGTRLNGYGTVDHLPMPSSCDGHWARAGGILCQGLRAVAQE
ncbi:hypothetical protein JB92DRAFT_2832613 [Gautieria morchelliformis]|nr:hypothetical protein JB92DRAFT_2832613 [Gautieria morchelliformis]